MKRLYIVEYKLFESTSLYSIHFEGKEHNETDDFILRFQSNSKYKENYQTILYWIKKIGEDGALERYFRPEWKASAIPVTSSKLRLYCIRFSDDILVLGNGDIKTAKKVKDCPNCYPLFKTMNDLKIQIDKSIRKKRTFIKEKKIEGKLDFLI